MFVQRFGTRVYHHISPYTLNPGSLTALYMRSERELLPLP